MKKIVSIFFSALMLIIPFSVAVEVNAAENNFTRVVNVVYDDSGSMLKENGKNIDRWCKAKYSMEVFASMLTESDTMNIYVMSDFDDEAPSSKKCQITLNGSDSVSTNVKKIHSMETMSGNTPFEAVTAAYKSLQKSSADEKWLVVLTDGEFNNKKNVNDFFQRKDEDIKVMFFGMGEAAATIKSNESKNIFTSNAKNSNDILNKVTSISVQVFNLHKLEGNKSDVPMSELIVFAQGKNVDLKGITDKNGKNIKGDNDLASVQYSTFASSTSKNVKVDENLIGKVIKYKGEYDAGVYNVSITGATTTEVYYKPYVEVYAKLIDKDGNDVTKEKNIQAGKYAIKFGLKNPITNKPIISKQLDEKYSAIVMSDGEKIASNISSGDTVEIGEGETTIDVTATFFEHNMVRNTIQLGVFKNKDIGFEVLNDPTYQVESDGINNINEPTQIKVSIDGRSFSKSEWKNLKLPSVEIEDDIDFKLGDFKVEKSDQVGVFNVYPTLVKDKPSTGTYCDTSVKLVYKDTVGKSTWSGSQKAVIKMKDNRSWLERNYDKIIKAVVSVLLFLLILGYLPPFKKYLPKEISAKPRVNCKPVRYGKKATVSFGNYSKKISTTLLPYVAERGTIRFVPMGVTGVPSAEVKAAGGRMMYITNYKAFCKKNYILFDGQKFKDDADKHLRFSSGVNIKAKTQQFEYTCTLTK